jgi:hypothetical protein
MMHPKEPGGWQDADAPATPAKETGKKQQTQHGSTRQQGDKSKDQGKQQG